MQPERSTPDPAAVHRAVQMALHLPTRESGRLRVQVLDRHGHLLASTVLEGPEQAAFLKDMLQNVGAFDMVPAAIASERGCDVLLREAHASRLAEQARDLVRPGSGGNWPGRGEFSALAPGGAATA
jgi:hypothetical protein